jgi:hypothetical protein
MAVSRVEGASGPAHVLAKQLQNTSAVAKLH